MSPRLIIEQLSRTKLDGSIEKLEFVEGVNAIVGPQNTGKSTWLRMLDFLMGDDGSVNTKFDEAIVLKYCAVSALMRLGDYVVELERTWSDGGLRSQTFLNGDRITADDVQPLFLDSLKIPLLRYPQGNIYASDRTWPTLGWRSLLRHIYRRQDHWSDLIPQQPESEQHACVLQFLGLAEHLFSPDLSLLTDKRKRLVQLETRKEHYSELLRNLVPKLMDDENLAGHVSLDTINEARIRIDSDLGALLYEREQTILKLRKDSQLPPIRLNALMERRTSVLTNREELQRDVSAIKNRLGEIEQYKTSLARELVRLDRADATASILEDLKVTHCPACDQSVDSKARGTDCCFLCGQLTLESEASKEAASRRLKFEREQIAAELAEAEDLIAVANLDLRNKSSAASQNERELQEIGHALRPFQASFSAVLPEEVALIDQSIGTLNAKRQTADVLRDSLQTSFELNDEITMLRSEIRHLESSIANHESKVDFDEASVRLTEGFNNYLNSIRSADEKSWTKTGEVSVSISDRRTQLLIGGRPAKPQLGGTLTIYFLFAYHYALLNLSRYDGCHYPGITILDFYPDIARESALGDRVQLVLSPFVALSLEPAIEPIQIIATSRALPERPNINYIHLTETWR